MKPHMLHSKPLPLHLMLCDPMDCSLPGPSVHEVLQARYWSGLPCPPPGDLPHPGIEPASFTSPALAGRFFTLAPPGKPISEIRAPSKSKPQDLSMLPYMVMGTLHMGLS